MSRSGLQLARSMIPNGLLRKPLLLGGDIAGVAGAIDLRYCPHLFQLVEDDQVTPLAYQFVVTDGGNRGVSMGNSSVNGKLGPGLNRSPWLPGVNRRYA